MLRLSEVGDCDEIVRVWASASALAHPFLSQAFLESERYNIPNVYLPMTETWVWDTGEEVAGFISLLGSDIGALFVDPTRHGQGIGRALVRQAQALRGSLAVEVFERNALGRAFYERLGFRHLNFKVHEQTGYTLLRLSLSADASI